MRYSTYRNPTPKLHRNTSYNLVSVVYVIANESGLIGKYCQLNMDYPTIGLCNTCTSLRGTADILAKYRWVHCYFCYPTKFRIDPIITPWNIAKIRFSKWRPSAILNLQNFRLSQITLLLSSVVQTVTVYLLIVGYKMGGSFWSGRPSRLCAVGDDCQLEDGFISYSNHRLD